MADTRTFTVTFTETKVTQGNYSDSSINIQSKLHSKAGSALLAAIAILDGKNQDNQVDTNTHPKGEKGDVNTVSVKAELTVDQCLNLCDRIEKNANTKKYVEKREVYLSLKRQYGNLQSLNPVERAQAMRALKENSYSYFKVDTAINLPSAIYLRKKNPTTEKLGETVKRIKALTCHKLCGSHELPTHDDLKNWISSFLVGEDIHWIADESKNPSTPDPTPQTEPPGDDSGNSSSINGEE